MISKKLYQKKNEDKTAKIKYALSIDKNNFSILKDEDTESKDKTHVLSKATIKKESKQKNLQLIKIDNGDKLIENISADEIEKETINYNDNKEFIKR